MAMIQDNGGLEKFQSSPSFKAGRSAILGGVQVVSYLFQSSPSFKAGRSRTFSAMKQRGLSFNPRPALRLGAPFSDNRPDNHTYVSILAQL